MAAPGPGRGAAGLVWVWPGALSSGFPTSRSPPSSAVPGTPREAGCGGFPGQQVGLGTTQEGRVGRAELTLAEARRTLGELDAGRRGERGWLCAFLSTCGGWGEGGGAGAGGAWRALGRALPSPVSSPSSCPLLPQPRARGPRPALATGPASLRPRPPQTERSCKLLFSRNGPALEYFRASPPWACPSSRVWF